MVKSIICNNKIKYVDYFTLDKVLMLNLSPTQERIYRCLLSHKNKNQEYSFPSQAKIAQETRMSIKTIQRSLKILVEKGFIIIQKMKKIIGHYNKYKLLYVACMEVVRKKKYEKMQLDNDSDCDKKSINSNNINNTKSESNQKVNKLLGFTKIKKISKKQIVSIKEFDIITINQTIARIKNGITKMPRTATLLIDKLCDTAVGLGKLSDWQYKKYNIIRPR